MADSPLNQPRATYHNLRSACGSAGLLIKARLLFEQRKSRSTECSTPIVRARTESNYVCNGEDEYVLHDYTDSSFAIGDTFRNPGFTEGHASNILTTL